MVLKDETDAHWPEVASASAVPHGQDSWADQLPYWRQQLAGVTAIRLPGDRPGRSGRRENASNTDTNGAWASCGFEVPAGLIARLACLADEHDLSSLDISVAALAIVLARYTGREDIAVATEASPEATRKPSDGWPGEHCAEPVNMVVLRSQVTGSASLLDLLLQVQGTVTEGHAHSRIPFDVLAGELGVGWDLMRAVVVGECTPAPSAADIAVRLHAWKAGLAGVVECRRGPFGTPTAEQLAGHLVRVLSGIAGAPEMRLDEVERSCLTANGPPTPALPPPRTPPPRISPTTDTSTSNVPDSNVPGSNVPHHRYSRLEHSQLGYFHIG